MHEEYNSVFESIVEDFYIHIFTCCSYIVHTGHIVGDFFTILGTSIKFLIVPEELVLTGTI